MEGRPPDTIVARLACADSCTFTLVTSPAAVQPVPASLAVIGLLVEPLWVKSLHPRPVVILLMPQSRSNYRLRQDFQRRIDNSLITCTAA